MGPIIIFWSRGTSYKAVRRIAIAGVLPVIGFVGGCVVQDGRGPAEVLRLPVALSKPLVAIVFPSQGGSTRALKKPVMP